MLSNLVITLSSVMVFHATRPLWRWGVGRDLNSQNLCPNQYKTFLRKLIIILETIILQLTVIIHWCNSAAWWRHQMETFSALLAPHKGQWRGAMMFCLICVWIDGWVNNGEAGDLRRYRAHYDVTVMQLTVIIHWCNSTGYPVRRENHKCRRTVPQ